jgi:hypothetical protein
VRFAAKSLDAGGFSIRETEQAAQSAENLSASSKGEDFKESSMMIRSTTAAAPRLDPRNQRIVPRTQQTRVDAIDVFENASLPKVTAPKPQLQVTQSAQTGSSGGFFSNLFGSIKHAIGGLFQKGADFFNANWGSWVGKAKDYVVGLYDKYTTMAGDWISRLLQKITGGLQS